MRASESASGWVPACVRVVLLGGPSFALKDKPIGNYSLLGVPCFETDMFCVNLRGPLWTSKACGGNKVHQTTRHSLPAASNRRPLAAWWSESVSELLEPSPSSDSPCRLASEPSVQGCRVAVGNAGRDSKMWGWCHPSLPRKKLLFKQAPKRGEP